MSAPQRQALFGCDEPPTSRLSLRAGALSFDLVGGRFGPVRVDAHEVWHGLAFLFRDSGWGTPEPVFEKVQHRQGAESFELNLQGYIPGAPYDETSTLANGPRILIDLQVQGHANGQLDFQADAVVTHDLLANRCGWILMYPMSAAGSAVEIEHTDGRTSRSTLPQEVSAWPLFSALSLIRHEYAPGRWAEAQLAGEDYELEDQRNNADASFKVYSRSNWMPRPYVLRRHQAWSRKLHLRLVGSKPVVLPPSFAGVAKLPLPKNAGPELSLGLAITLAMTRANSTWLLSALAQLRPAFLHLTLWPDSPIESLDWTGVGKLLRAAGASLRLDLCGREELGLGGTQDAECRTLAERLASAGVVPSSMAALPCGKKAAAFLREVFPASLIGGGTPHFFAQINRLEVSGGEDFMAFTVCPIVHGADDEAVMHGTQSLPSMLATARRRHPARQWHLGPSGLPARASPLGRQPQSDGLHRVALASRDPRTRGLFGAAWLLGHIAAAVQAEVNALTLPPVMGDDGLWWLDGDRWQMTPSAAMLQVCLCWKNIEQVSFEVAEGGPLSAISGTTSEGRQVLIANRTGQVQTLRCLFGGRWARMNAHSWLQHVASPSASPWCDMPSSPFEYDFSPYELVRIDLANALTGG